jgi:hypothetical protein
MRTAIITIWLLAAAVWSASPVLAANPQDAIWKLGARCNKEAFVKFPDHTPDHAAKRDRFVRECQLRARTPVQAPIASAPAPSTSGTGQE